MHGKNKNSITTPILWIDGIDGDDDEQSKEAPRNFGKSDQADSSVSFEYIYDDARPCRVRSASPLHRLCERSMTSPTEKSAESRTVNSEDLSATSDVSQKDPLPSTTRVILLATCLTFANVLTAIGNTGVQVLLDEISASLNISENNLQWIFNSMQLPFASISPSKFAEIR
jgi:hypothetical protein